MKKLSRVLALSLAFIMLIGTTTFAAVPNNSVTIGNRAISIDYIFNYLEDAKVLVNSLLDENPDSSIFFQLDGQNERFTDPFTGTEATEEDLAEVSVFIDENGEEQELEQKELEVVKVSAINDLDSKTVKVKGEVVKAEELEGEVAIVAELFEADKDGKFPEEGTEVTVELDEDGKFEFEVIDVEKYNAGEYKVVIKVTVGEEEAEAVAEFVIDEDELKAVDKIVDAVLNARNQPELLEALQNDKFEGKVNPDLIVEYDEKIKEEANNIKTVNDIKDILDKVNESEVETELLGKIKEAAEKNQQIKLENLLLEAELKYKDSEEVVEVKVQKGIVHDYMAALRKKDNDEEVYKGLESLEDLAKVIDKENKRPLEEINKMQVKKYNDNDWDESINTVKNNADRLGLDLTEFGKLEPQRQRAVVNDLIQNKPEDGHTEETVKAMFSEIVETRLVFEESVELFSNASSDEPLEDLTFITMLIEQLESVSYEKHSNESIKEVRLPELKDLVDRFNALEGEKVKANNGDENEWIDAQEKVLATINYTKTTSSTATRKALDTALTNVEGEVEELSKVTSVEAKIETELPEGNKVKAGTIVTVKLTAKNNGDTQEKFNKVIPRIDVKHGNDNGNYIVLRNVVFEKGIATVEVKLEKVGEGNLNFGKIANATEDTTTTENIKVVAGDLTVIEGKPAENLKSVTLTGQDDYKNPINLDAGNVVDATIDGEDILLANIKDSNEEVPSKTLTISDLELEAETEYTITLVYKVGEETKTFEIKFKTPKVETTQE